MAFWNSIRRNTSCLENECPSLRSHSPKSTIKLRLGAATVTGSLLVAPLLGVASVAMVAATSSPAAAAVDNLSLSWDGKNYASSTTESFLKPIKVVPGDNEARVMRVKNVGPGPGVLKVTLVDIVAQPDVNDDFFERLKVGWDGDIATGEKPFKEITGNPDGTYLIGSKALSKNGTADILLAYDYPLSSPNLANGWDPSRLASFNVKLEIVGTTRAALSLKITPHLQDRDRDQIGDLGEKVKWEFTVTNTGDETIRDLTINSTYLKSRNAKVTCEASTLDVGATTTCWASTVINANDFKTGLNKINLNAVASGIREDGAPVNSPTAFSNVPIHKHNPSTFHPANPNTPIGSGSDKSPGSFIDTPGGRIDTGDLAVTDETTLMKMGFGIIALSILMMVFGAIRRRRREREAD